MRTLRVQGSQHEINDIMYMCLNFNSQVHDYFFPDLVCSCLPYCCVCNDNNNVAVQEHPASYHNDDNNHQQQRWASERVEFQNYQMHGPPAAVPMTSATDSAVSDYGLFVDEPVQVASVVQAVYQQPLSVCETRVDDSKFQLQHNASYYHNYSPTTLLDLGSGTIHKNPNDNDCQNFQTAMDYHQCFQQNCDHNNGYHQLQYASAPIKTESDCNRQEPLDPVYYPTMTSHDEYYTHVSSSSPSTDIVKTSGMGLDDSCSIDFIGDSSLPDTSVTAGDFMAMDPTKLLTNNNYYMDAYCGTEANNNTIAAFNEFQLNATDMHWSHQ